MGKTENKIWDWITDHLVLLILIAGTMIGLYIRFCLRDHISADMEVHLLSWYRTIKEGGGFRALTTTVGDYNIPYQVLIAGMTCFPINPVYGYKIISIVFDLLLAGATGWLVWILTESRMKAAYAYVITLCFPMVFLNSAMWGQCDSIYTFFCVCSLICYLRKQDTLCFVFLGLGLAFKLQAVFLLPLLLFLYGKERRFSIWKLILLPVPMVVLSLPAIVQGRNVLDVFKVYYQQAGSYPYVAVNYPSFWSLMIPNKNTDYYPVFKGIAIAFALLVLILLMVYFLKQDKHDHRRILFEGFIFAYACVLFLPAMHERYDYLYMILGLVLVFLEIRTLPLFLGLCILNMKAYFAFLLEVPVNWEILSIVNVLVFFGYLLLGSGFWGKAWKRRQIK